MPSLSRVAEAELGCAVIVCRNRRRSDVALDTGAPWLQLIGLPLVAALMLTLPLCLIAKYQRIPPPLYLDPVWGPVLSGAFVCWAAVIYGYFFSVPRSVSLVLHENGFRYRRRRVRFEELAQIQGYRLNFPPRRRAIYASALEMASQIKKRSEECSLSVYLKNGDHFAMKNALAEYNFGDLQLVLRAIAGRCPGVLRQPG